MRSTTTAASTFSLRAPIANEEERALFQRRLALTAALVFVLALGFYLVQLAFAAAIAPAHVIHLVTSPSALMQLGTTFMSGALWLVLRRNKKSVSTLSAFDLGASFAICLGWALMISMGASRGERPESIALLASSYTLVCRAAFIPSTPARTALVAVLGLGPIVVVTHFLYRAQPPSYAMPLPPEIYVAIWALLGTAATTVISFVVHGLRLEVRKAMRLGQYLLEEKIGEGGMGVVYRASHALLRRPAAIKLLSRAADHGIARFEREVQITARLTHPNTVAVFDYGRTPDGTFYYAMEFLDGVSLEDLVAEHGPQPARRVVHLLLQTCGALEEAHARGLVHRDIKPANIMLTERGLLPDVVKVLDFGLVKETQSTGEVGESSVNAVMGTPHYMAPEAILDPANIDGRADLYALGGTAYYLLTGERVFDGANLVEVCSQHLHQAPVPPSQKRSDVPESVEKIVLTCLAKKRDDRPHDATALIAMLKDVEDELGEWSREEARAWWAERARRSSGVPRAADPDDSTALGRTIAVALDGRRGAA